MNIIGDLLGSSDVSAPGANTVLVDSTGLSSGAPNHGYYDLCFILNSTVAATFEMGIYNSDDSVDRVFSQSVQGGQGKFVPLSNVAIMDGQKVKVRNKTALLIGVVNVAINLRINSID